MYSHHIDSKNDHIEVLFKIITNKINKSKSLSINLNSLQINKEIKETWIIPDNNFIDVNYIVKEEIKLGIKTEITNKNCPKLELDKPRKTKNSVLDKKISLNLNVNKTNKHTLSNISSEGNKNIFIINNRNIKSNNSHKINTKKFFMNIRDTNSTNISLTNKKNKENTFEYINNSHYKNERFNSFFIGKDNNIKEQFYAFNNLVNLNKDKSADEKINKKGMPNKEIILKKKKKLEKSLNKEKFFLKDSKVYFNEDKQLNENNDRKNNDLMKTKLKLDEPHKEKIEHKSTIFSQSRNNGELLEYDGDKDSVTLRQINKKGEILKNKNENK